MPPSPCPLSLPFSLPTSSRSSSSCPPYPGLHLCPISHLLFSPFTWAVAVVTSSVAGETGEPLAQRASSLSLSVLGFSGVTSLGCLPNLCHSGASLLKESWVLTSQGANFVHVERGRVLSYSWIFPLAGSPVATLCLPPPSPLLLLFVLLLFRFLLCPAPFVSGSHCAAQADLKVLILLSPPAECLDHRRAPRPCTAHTELFIVLIDF